MVDTGLLDWAGVAERMSATPARIGRVADHGRPIAVGEPANLVLYRPGRRRHGRRRRVGSLSRNTPYAGLELPGRWSPRSCAARPTVLDGKLGVTAAARCSSSRTAGSFRGESYGADGETFGEAVFNTGMTGYQETLTDPSYHRQVVVMTAPHIGNTGVNDEDPESRRIWVAGYVVRDPARVAVQLALAAHPRRRAARAGRGRHLAASTPAR